MTRLTVDAAFLARLDKLDSIVEVCDESGRTVGYFHSVLASNAGAARSPFSDEEIQRRRQQRTGRALSEIMADLEKS
jgi:hypothetical protein